MAAVSFAHNQWSGRPDVTERLMAGPSDVLQFNDKAPH